MKQWAKVLTAMCVACALAAALALVGCSSGSADKGAKAGTYELYELQSETDAVSHDDIELVKSFGLTTSLQLNEDGTGVFDVFGTTTDITWDAENIYIDGEATPYTYEDGKVSISADGDTMVFALEEE